MKPWITISIIIFWLVAGYFTNWEPTEDKLTAYPKEIPIPIQLILERSCYDCHSNHTKIPWYGKVFPVNLYLKDHVDEGKDSMNLSEWDNLSARKRATWSFNMLEEIESSSMPPSSYLLLHGDAILSEEEIAGLKDWQSILEKIYEKENE